MKKARILIVEDEAIIAMEIENQLQSLRYEVTSIVDTGEKAIKRAEEDKPDLILMDIRIKGEMDGIEAAEVIRNKFGIPVIFSTAYLDEERIERAKITMPFGYVLKPIQERDLKVTIEMALYVSKVNVEREKIEEERDRILNLSSDLICIAGTDGYFRYLNPAWENMMGYTIKEMLSRSFLDFIHPEDHNINDKEVANLTAGNETIGFQNRYICKNDSIQTISWRATYLPEMHAMYCIGRNITENIHAEEALKKSEHKLATHIELTPLGIIEFDNEFKAISWNPGAEKIFGFTKEEVISKNSLDLLVPDYDYERVKKIHLWQNPTAGENINDNKTKDGRIITCHWFNTPMYDVHGNVTGMTAVCKDITNQLKTEQALKENEAKYRKLFEDSIDGYALGDPDTGIISDCNQALADLVRRTKEEIIGKHQSILHPPSQIEKGFSSTFKQHVNEKSGKVLPAQIITKDGELKNVNIRARVFELNNRKVIHGIFRLLEK